MDTETAAEIASRWRDGVRAELPAAIRLRHTVHADPRLSGDEADTAEVIADAIGCGPGEVVAGTGRWITVSDGPADTAAVLLRAELDALPVVEETGVPWASTSAAMHACGHDVHLAALAAVARAARALAADLPLGLGVLLQPREEPAESGARDVVSQTSLRGVDAVVAAHVQPRLPAGTFGVTPGAVNAGTTAFTITVTGTGGHSAYPHTVSDPVLALAAIVMAALQVPARLTDPVTGSVLMITQLQAGSAANVVPDVAVAHGTLRSVDAVSEAAAREQLSRIASAVAQGYGCSAVLTVDGAQPSLLNDPGLAAGAATLLADWGRPVDRSWRSFGSDDFANYAGNARILMTFVGTGDDGGGLHEARYLPDDLYITLVADALIAGYLAAC